MSKIKKKLKILIAERDFSVQAKEILAKTGYVTDFFSHNNFLRNLPSADAVITGLEVQFNKAMLDRAKNLKLIASRTTQLRYLDLGECKRRGIKVVNIKAESPILQKTSSTAEEAMALILALWRKIPWAFDNLKNKKWDRKKYAGHELAEKTIGLIGFGRLGKMVAHYSRAFGMKVIAYDPYVGDAQMQACGVKKISLPILLKVADVVSLHSIYDESTQGMLTEKYFKMMKPSAIFINTARGEITDEAALLNALKKRWIAGAAIDTLAGEKPDGSHLKNNPLVEYAIRNDNLIILPHLGGSTHEANQRTQVYVSELAIEAIKNISRNKNS